MPLFERLMLKLERTRLTSTSGLAIGQNTELIFKAIRLSSGGRWNA